jgi:hypothetical protein
MNISCRDHFAGKAMAAIIGDEPPTIEFASAIVGVDKNDYDATVHWPEYVAVISYKIANAMLKERDK